MVRDGGDIIDLVEMLKGAATLTERERAIREVWAGGRISLRDYKDLKLAMETCPHEADKWLLYELRVATIRRVMFARTDVQRDRTRPPQLPRLLVGVLVVLLGRDQLEAIGDLEEEFPLRVEMGGRTAACVWYYKQVVVSAIVLLAPAAIRGARWGITVLGLGNVDNIVDWIRERIG